MEQKRSLKHRKTGDILKSMLADLKLGDIRFFEQIDSTNREAADWANQDAPDLSLVIANEQLAGKGRLQRRWYTPPDSALAFSLIIRSPNTTNAQLESDRKNEYSSLRWTAMGALAICQVLQEQYFLQAEIKWPNDVLVGGRKVAGILVEASWQAGSLQTIILGVGINVSPASVPPDELVSFPATCVSAAIGYPVDRFKLLQAVISQIKVWIHEMDTPHFVLSWDRCLAFKGNSVTVVNSFPDQQSAITGTLLGLDEQGRLRLQVSQGEELLLASGELSLRPLN